MWRESCFDIGITTINDPRKQMHQHPSRRWAPVIAIAIGLSAGAFTTHAGAATVFSEDFDGVNAPALPSGWATTRLAGTMDFGTSSARSVSSPNSVHIRTQNSGDSVLTSPVISLSGATNATLSFMQKTDIENPFDGAMLEASIGGGAFADILALGGTFTAGGYNNVIQPGFGNLNEGRSSWSGFSSQGTAFFATIVDLPASADGQNVQFRWRFSTDSSVTYEGWYIDSVVVTADTASTSVPEPAPALLAALGVLGVATRRRRG